MKSLDKSVLLQSLPGRKLCLADWRYLAQPHFDEIEPLLTICIGEVTSTYPLPHIPEFRLNVDRRGDRFVAYTVGDWDQVADDLALTLDDVQLWHLTPDRLQQYLATANTPPVANDARPVARVIGGFTTIILPSGRKMSLAKKHKRRAFLRAMVQWCRMNATDVFHAQDIIDDYNASLSKTDAQSKAINSDRIIDDLFKGQKAEFLELFDVLDLAASEFRIKVEFQGTRI